MNGGDEINAIIARLIAELTKEGFKSGSDATKKMLNAICRVVVKKMQLQKSTLTPGQKTLLAMRESGQNIKMVKMNTKDLDMFKKHAGKHIPYAVVKTKGDKVRVLTKESDQDLLISIMKEAQAEKMKNILKNTMNKTKRGILKGIKNILTGLNNTLKKRINNLEKKLANDLPAHDKHSIDISNPDESVTLSNSKNKDNDDKKQVLQNEETKNESKNDNIKGDKDDLKKSLKFEERMKKAEITQITENSKTKGTNISKTKKRTQSKGGRS